MDPNTPPIHLGIASYDDGPPPTPPRTISLCIIGRTVGAIVAGPGDAVTCPACLNYMREIGL